MYHLVLPHTLHTLNTFVANLGFFQFAIADKNSFFNLLAFAILDFLAIYNSYKNKLFFKRETHFL